MDVGNVSSKHFVLALKVTTAVSVDGIQTMIWDCNQSILNFWFVQLKSVLDPCEDETDDMEEDEVSLGDDSLQKEDSSESDSEVK